MMRVFSVVLVAFLASFGLMACNQDDPSNLGGVAVLDLDKVGNSLGRLNKISKEVEIFKGQQQAELVQLRDKLQAQVVAMKKTMGNNPSAEKVKVIKQKIRSAEQNIKKANNKANSQVKKYKNKLIIDFQNDARPIAKKVARDMGLSVILFRQNSLFWVDQRVDITEEVIKAMSGN